MATFVYTLANVTSEQEFNNGIFYIDNGQGVYTRALEYKAGQIYYERAAITISKVYLETQDGEYREMQLASISVASPEWEEEN